MFPYRKEYIKNKENLFAKQMKNFSISDDICEKNQYVKMVNYLMIYAYI